MTRPNGNGSITKVKGARRKPYKVTITIGWKNDSGKQIKKCIGYYATAKEAEKVLVDFNINPFNLDLASLTFQDIYERWSKTKYKNVSSSSIVGYSSAYNAVSKIHNMKFKDIKAIHLQEAMDESNKGYPTKRKIKYLYSQLFAYAMSNDIVFKDYSPFINIGKKEKESERIPFTEKEISKLWEYENKTGGIKTEAGKNRLVPIHPKILPLIEKRYNESNELFIVNAKGKEMKYSNYYREKFLPIMENLNMKHRPHDCRHTFATLLSNANANSTAIKKMIGHESFITTEKIYTHKDIEELRKNIELIK